MRYVYIDEAGTSDREPIAVVVGVVIHADQQWRSVAQYLEFLRLRYVPESIRKNYVFHAKDLFAGGRHGRLFADGYRWRVLNRLVSAPRKFGLGVAVGYALKERDDAPDRGGVLKHMLALLMCLKQANDFIRVEYPGEIATAIAEDVTHARSMLKKVPTFFSEMRDHADILPTLMMKEHPYDVLVDSIHFTPKADAPLLQIADACAFALRRNFTGGSRGADLIRSFTGGTKGVSLPGAGAGMRMFTWPRTFSLPLISSKVVAEPRVQWL